MVDWIRKGISPINKIFYSIRAYVLNKMFLFDWKDFIRVVAGIHPGGRRNQDSEQWYHIFLLRIGASACEQKKQQSN